MQNEFEKKVQQTFSGFSITPGEDVWEHVAKRVRQQKKRRRLAFIWWTSALIILTGAAGYWFSQSGTHEPVKNEIANKTVQQRTADTSIETNSQTLNAAADDVKLTVQQDAADDELKPKTPKIEREPAAQTPAEGSGQQLAQANRNHTNGTTTNTTRNTTNNTAVLNHENPVSHDEITGAKPGTSTKKPEVSSNQKEAETAATQAADPPIAAAGLHSNTNTADGQIPESELANKPQQATASNDSAAELQKNIVAKDSMANPVQPGVTAKATKTKKTSIRFGLAVSAGMSDNVSGFELFENRANDLYYSSPNNSTQQPGNVPYLPPPIYTSRFSGGLGGFVVVNTGKRVNLSAGLNYHFYSAGSYTGSKSNQQRTVFDSLANKDFVVENYYVAGSTGFSTAPAMFTNQYHYLQVPLSVQLKLNGSHPRDVLLTAGLSPMFLLHSKALYYDRFNNIIYVNEHQFKKFGLAAEAGFLFEPFKFRNVTFQLGPQVSYSLTNITRKIYNTPQHLLFGGVSANLLLKK